MEYQNDPWAEALAQQENERRSQRDAQMQDDQTAVNDEMGEVVRRAAMENAKRQMSFNNLLASAVKFSNGGELPEVVRNYMNRKMGFDGVKTGVLGGGYQQDGSYAFDFANGVDQQGAVVRQRQSFGPTSLYNMMSQNRVAFNDADRSSMRKNLIRLGYSEKEVSDMDSALAVSYGGSNQGTPGSAQNGKVADPDHISNRLGADGRSLGRGAVMRMSDRRPRGIEVYSNVREPGYTAGGSVSGRRADGTRYYHNLGRKKTEAELWHQFSVGPSDDGKTQVRGYKNELTGEVAYVKDGENPPWRQAQGNNGKLSVDDRLAIEREKNKGRIDVENARGQNRIDVASANNAERRYATDANNNTRLKIADIGAELKRMGYDVDEKKLAEAIRHNKATEEQGQQRVDETTRHNKAGEAHRTAELGERTRHNAVTEEQGQQRLDETATHHAATEEQGNRRLDETERAHKAGEAHRTAELDERKRANAEKENAVKETLELKRRAQDLREDLAKPQNNVFTANADPKIIKAKMQEVETIQKIIRNGNLTPENRTLLRSQLNAITESLYGGDSTTTNKVTIKQGDNKGNGSQQKVKAPEGSQMPKGAIAFGGYKKNKKTGKLVPYWVGPDNEPIYR